VNITTAIDNVETSAHRTADWSVKGNRWTTCHRRHRQRHDRRRAGNDTVVFQGKSSEYQLVYSEGEAFITHLNGGVRQRWTVQRRARPVFRQDHRYRRRADHHGRGGRDFTGRSVAAAGDINNDGFDDFIIGASGAKGHAGAAYVVFGDADGLPPVLELKTLDGVNGFKLTGAAGDFAGFSVASAGDINKDGFDDLIIGASGADAHGKDSGAAYVVFGHAGGYDPNVNLGKLDGSDGFKLSGAPPTTLLANPCIPPAISTATAMPT